MKGSPSVRHPPRTDAAEITFPEGPAKYVYASVAAEIERELNEWRRQWRLESARADQAVEEVRQLREKGEAVIQLVEGPGCKRWSSGGGGFDRIKDTTEWCEFYTAWRTNFESKEQDKTKEQP